MSDKDAVLASADRAAARKLKEVRERAKKAMFTASANGLLNSGSLIRQVGEICLSGFVDICNAATEILAQVEGERAPALAQGLRNLLLVQQLAIDRTFAEFAVPGSSPIRNIFDGQLPAFHDELDRTLQGVLDDLALGLVNGRSLSTYQPASGVRVDLGGGAGQVIIGSPGAVQFVGGNLSAGGLDPKPLLEALSALREEVDAAPAQQELKDAVNDAIVSVEREIASVQPEPSRLKRYMSVVGDTAQKIGIGAAGSSLGRALQWLAGLG